MEKVHFIGIGGTGISAIARLLLERGVKVSGTDLHASPYFEAVSRLGAVTRLGHHPDLAVAADIVVRSSAVKANDPEVVAAQEVGIPVLKRSEFLPWLTKGENTLAIAGSHGKTTTTAMLVHLLRSASLDPSFILGAEIKGLDSNAHAGKDEFFIIEADEYDYMFLGLNPTISVVTNVEYDHPDFFRTPHDYSWAFVEFLGKTVGDGIALLSADDPGAQKLRPFLTFPAGQLLSFGFHPASDYRVVDYQALEGFQRFSLILPDGKQTRPFSIHQPGRFNVLNATAALAVAHLIGIDLDEIKDSLNSFEGTSRRFDLLCASEKVRVFNDYGHHPSQILQTIQGARQSYPSYTVWAVWEPHTLSRTLQMQHEFAKALREADQALILKLYSAREEDPGFSPCSIAEESGTNCIYQPDNEIAVEYIIANLTGKDIVIVFSAGKGPEFSQALCEALHLEATND
jgi:UDP-N-acetylmuramate--alanine ligase